MIDPRKPAPERFIQEEIGKIIHQIHNPITREPYREVSSLVAELVYWNDQLREVEKAGQAA